jgi:multidrug resistance efflux pump
MPVTDRLLSPPNAADPILRSEAMDELLSNRPSFLSRWALIFFAFVIVLIFALSWYIRYPEAVISRSKIMAVNTPKEIVVLKGGRLVKLFVANQAQIDSGQIIAFMESTGSHEKILQLPQYLDSVYQSVKHEKYNELEQLFQSPVEQMGELQVSYENFVAAYQKFLAYIGDGYYVKRIQRLQEDVALLQKSKMVLLQQKSLIEKDLSLSEESYSMQEKMFREKILSKLEDRMEQSKLVNKQMTIPQIQSQLLNNEASQKEKNKEVEALIFEIGQQKLIFLQEIQTFLSQVKSWIREYVIISSTSGKINFLFPIQEGMYLEVNRTLGYVNPSTTGYYAETYLPQGNFGKVLIGQSVQMRFDAYPYQEFGYVSGRLSYIADIPSDSGYLAHIELPNGLVTNQHQQLVYKNGLMAQTRVLVKDMKLGDRFFQEFRRVLDQ